MLRSARSRRRLHDRAAGLVGVAPEQRDDRAVGPAHLDIIDARAAGATLLARAGAVRTSPCRAGAMKLIWQASATVARLPALQA